MHDFHPNLPDDRHKCESCGATYDVSWESFPTDDPDEENCLCCGKLLASWASLRAPIFDLVGQGQPGAGLSA